MKKESFQLPAECVKCAGIYELNDDLIGEDWNKTLSDILTEKYGSDTLLCPKCRRIIRIIEEGSFKWVVYEDKDKKTEDLELISKDGNRRLWKVKNLAGKELTFEIIDNDNLE